MPFTITDFRSNALKLGGTRANLFDVTMTLPTIAGLTTDIMTYTVKAAQLPGSMVGVVEVPYFGRVVKVPGNKTFENWTVTVINDENFLVRNAMERWIASMGSHKENKIVSGGLQYGKAEVMQYGKDSDSEIAKYDFEKIFPVSVAEITLEWGDNDSIEEFAVEFAYDYWTHGTVVT